MVNKEYFNEKNKYDFPEMESLRELLVRYKEILANRAINDDLKYLFNLEYEMLFIEENALGVSFGGESRFYNGIWEKVKIDATRLEFYEECFKNTDNIYLRLRYLDYFVEIKAKKKYVYAKSYCIEALELLNRELNNDIFFITTLSRVINIALKFNLKDYANQIKQIIAIYLINLKKRSEYRWVSDISTLCRCINNKKWTELFDKFWSDELILILKEALNFFGEKEYIMYEIISLELIEWLKIDGNKEYEINRILKSVGEMLEFQAEYQCGVKEKRNLIRANFLEKALIWYQTYGFSEDISRLKVDIKKAYKSVDENNEWQEYRFNLPIPKSEIDNFVKAFNLQSLEDSFRLLSGINEFIPKLSIIHSQLNEQMKRFSATRLFGEKTIADGKKINEVITDEEWIKSQIYKQYNLSLELMYGVFYIAVFENLLSRGLNYEFIEEKINNWEYISEDNKKIINIGMQHFFKKDYISAMHILVPRFESCLRDFFEYAGYSTTSLKKNIVQNEQSLSEFIRNDFVKNTINEDFLFYIKYTMVEQLGCNFRNNIAHGLINIKSLNYKNCCMIINLYIKLLSYAWVRK